MCLQEFTEYSHTGVYRTVKVLFFIPDNRYNITLFLTEFRILKFIFMNNGINDLPKEGSLNIQEFSVACSTPH